QIHLQLIPPLAPSFMPKYGEADKRLSVKGTPCRSTMPHFAQHPVLQVLQLLLIPPGTFMSGWLMNQDALFHPVNPLNPFRTVNLMNQLNFIGLENQNSYRLA
ncbi:hypothetical protein K0U00_27415, partial [Paenibacillus sepulcri]|nr:hypothetical protein [Paenibacillus sepulcri]